ncbi:MAG: hypothetical protein R8K20_07570 [Gallionellaceae bacterium]
MTRPEMQQLFDDLLAKAETLINKTGYHRRDPELAALKAMLA